MSISASGTSPAKGQAAASPGAERSAPDQAPGVLLSLALPPPSYRHNELLHAVGGHAVQMCEVQLQVDLVVEHVLAQRAAERGLHRVLRHGMHPEPVDVGVAVLAVGALVHLWGTHPAPGPNLQFPAKQLPLPQPRQPERLLPAGVHVPPASLTCSPLVSSAVLGLLEERGDSELPGKEMRLEAAEESVSSFSAWLDEAGREEERQREGVTRQSSQGENRRSRLARVSWNCPHVKKDVTSGLLSWEKKQEFVPTLLTPQFPATTLATTERP